MNQDVNLNLIHHYLAAECTAEEMRHLRRWMEADPANRQAVETLQKIWEVQPRKEIESDIQLAWKRLEEQLDARRSETLSRLVTKQKRSFRARISGYMWIRVAAVIVFAFLLSLFFIEFRGSEPETQTEIAMREVVTKRAHQAQMTFSDGTRVVLNAASHIRFPERFDPKVREVYLEGEAYFEVAHKPGTAFIVRTGDVRVKVLGTKFNVKARPEEQKVEVAVAEGKVSVQSESTVSPDSVSEVVLTTNQMSIVKKGRSPTPPETVNISNYLTWLRGDFVFDRVLFAEVLREWERRFDVDFVVRDSSLLSVSFSGEFRNEPLNEMLRLASQSLAFSYHRNDRTITIKKDFSRK